MKPDQIYETLVAFFVVGVRIFCVEFTLQIKYRVTI